MLLFTRLALVLGRLKFQLNPQTKILDSHVTDSSKL